MLGFGHQSRTSPRRKIHHSCSSSCLPLEARSWPTLIDLLAALFLRLHWPQDGPLSAGAVHQLHDCLIHGPTHVAACQSIPGLNPLMEKMDERMFWKEGGFGYNLAQ